MSYSDYKLTEYFITQMIWFYGYCLIDTRKTCYMYVATATQNLKTAAILVYGHVHIL